MLKINSIELTDYCNLSCKYCPNSTVTKQKGFISLETFKKALSYSEESVHLSLFGEPFLHPNLIELIRLAKETKIVSFHTNGTLLTTELCKDLVDTNIDIIEISVHNEKSLIGFKRLIDEIEKQEKKTVVSCSVMTTNECIFPEPSGNVLKLKGWIKNIGIEERHYPLIRLQTLHNWALDDPDSERKLMKNCIFINNDICVVKWNGDVLACCFDFNSDNYIGHIDDFPNLKHRKDYKLCERCSPSWVNIGGGSNGNFWYSIDFIKPI